MTIDAHTHLSDRWLNLRWIKPKDFVGIWDRRDIDKACVLTLEGLFDARAANDRLRAMIKGYEPALSHCLRRPTLIFSR